MDALIVTSTPRSQQAIASVVAYGGEYDATFACGTVEALRLICHRAFDLVIINNEQGTARAKETALTAAARKEGGVILLENAQHFEETLMEVTKCGVIVVPKPLTRVSLLAAVQTVYAANMRLNCLREENRDLSKKLEDMKVVNRAKIALIQKLGYTESEAHKYIEKQAMNLRISKREVAVNILKTYEF